MKNNYVRSPLCSGSSLMLLPLALAMACGLGVASAATTLTVSGTAPTPDADDFYQPYADPRPGGEYWSGINMSAGNYPVGNTFLTGSSSGGYVFDNFSVYVKFPNNAAVGQTFRMNFYSINTTTNVATSVYSASGALTTAPTTGNFLTFTSDDGFLLLPNTTYAVTITGTSGANMEFGYDGNNEFGGGRITRVLPDENNPGVLITDPAGNPSFDMTFYLGLTAAAIPEPASLALVALGGGLLLRRKRC